MLLIADTPLEQLIQHHEQHCHQYTQNDTIVLPCAVDDTDEVNICAPSSRLLTMAAALTSGVALLWTSQPYIFTFGTLLMNAIAASGMEKTFTDAVDAQWAEVVQKIERKSAEFQMTGDKIMQQLVDMQMAGQGYCAGNRRTLQSMEKQKVFGGPMRMIFEQGLKQLIMTMTSMLDTDANMTIKTNNNMQCIPLLVDLQLLKKQLKALTERVIAQNKSSSYRKFWWTLVRRRRLRAMKHAAVLFDDWRLLLEDYNTCPQRSIVNNHKPRATVHQLELHIRSISARLTIFLGRQQISLNGDETIGAEELQDLHFCKYQLDGARLCIERLLAEKSQKKPAALVDALSKGEQEPTDTRQVSAAQEIFSSSSTETGVDSISYNLADVIRSRLQRPGCVWEGESVSAKEVRGCVTLLKAESSEEKDFNVSAARPPVSLADEIAMLNELRATLSARGGPLYTDIVSDIDLRTS